MLAQRDWVPVACEAYVQSLAGETAAAGNAALEARIDALIDENRRIHETACFNLNPATNVMNPKAEAVLARGLGSRPSLGYPGDKYEMGLEAIEQIEVIAAELCVEIFGARYAEIRVPSGAIANLYAFMATCEPGDPVIVPPAAIGGHVTHHAGGAAGLYRLDIHPAPVNADGYTVDLGGLRELAARVNPKLITLGGSLNLFPHPVREVRAIADGTGATLMVDAAHQCGLFAGRAWPNPLDEGAHLMTMSTYKSLGGPAGGLIVSNDGVLMQRIDAIAFPGLTANFDAAKSAALALTMLDWRQHGAEYAAAMVATAKALAGDLSDRGVPVFTPPRGATDSHQFAVDARPYGGGQAAAKRLREAGFLTCGIGLPLPAIEGDMNGLRFGTPEIVRWGVGPADTGALAALIAEALGSETPAEIAPRTAALRAKFDRIHFIR